MNIDFICDDSESFLKTIDKNSIRLVVTSPPYNLNKEYEKKESLDNYIKNMDNIIKEINRVLVDGGSVCWQVGNYVDDGEIIPLDYLFWNKFREYGFKLRNRIIWTFSHGLHCKKRLSGRYEIILWMTKGDNYLFNLDPIRVKQKYPNKKYFKGPKKGQLSCNPLGCNPSDVWKTIDNDWESKVWDIPNVKNNHPEKEDHPCQFPVSLVERCVLALSLENESIIDPFGGTGTVAIAAALHNRNCISIDRNEKYTNIAIERYNKLKNGQLSIQPINR